MLKLAIGCNTIECDKTKGLYLIEYLLTRYRRMTVPIRRCRRQLIPEGVTIAFTIVVIGMMDTI